MRLSHIKEATFTRANMLLKQLNSRSPSIQNTQSTASNQDETPENQETIPLGSHQNSKATVETELNNVR
jgi:hypothetical protein